MVEVGDRSVNQALRIALCTYSATRNTAVLADAAAEQLQAAGHAVERFDMLAVVRGKPPSLTGFDLIGLATPVMMFRPPWVARRFLERLEVVEPPRPAFLLLSSAGLPVNSADTLRRLAIDKGLELGWCREVSCADSFIPFRKWFGARRDKGRPDAASLEGVRQFVDEVTADLAAERRGRVPSRPRSPWHLLFRNAPEDGARMMLGKRLLLEDDCTGCGLCAELCPTGAIRMEGPLPRVDAEACLGCCACFNRCPPRAWRLRRFAPRHFYEGPTVLG